MNPGRPQDLDPLLPELYSELKKLALHALPPHARGGTLQPTALVHEAYLRLRRAHHLDVSNKKRLLALAGKVMRQVLVDFARERGRVKRGGDADTVLLGDDVADRQRPLLDLLALDEALERLGRLDPRQVEIVELRFLAGLTVEETAETLELSPTTIKREAAMAKAFLLSTLSRPEEP